MARPMATRWRWPPESWRGIALEQRREPEDLRGALDARLDLLLRRAAQLQREGHVVGDRHVRVERVVLEHHGDVALFRRHVVDDALADADLSRGDVLEPGDHPQQGRLAAARRPDQDDELAVADVDVDAVNDLKRAEGLADLTDGHRRHALPPRRAEPPSPRAVAHLGL